MTTADIEIHCNGIEEVTRADWGKKSNQKVTLSECDIDDLLPKLDDYELLQNSLEYKEAEPIMNTLREMIDYQIAAGDEPVSQESVRQIIALADEILGAFGC